MSTSGSPNKLGKPKVWQVSSWRGVERLNPHLGIKIGDNPTNSSTLSPKSRSDSEVTI